MVDVGVRALKKGNAMFYGTMMLTGANLLLRFVSMGFQVYLSRRIGAGGVGLLQLIFSVAGLSYTLGAAGVRICAMYLSAEALGQDRPQAIGSVLSGCIRYSLCFSLPVALCLWVFAPSAAEIWLGNPAAGPSLRTYALSLPLACLYGVMTGYFTAAGRIRALVLIEFAEQACAMGVTVALLGRAGTEAGRCCQAVVTGGAASTVLSLVLLLILYRRTAPAQDRKLSPPYRKILRTALPLALTDDLRSGLSAAENLLVPKRLVLYPGTVNALADYGMICGMVFPVMMFPAAILFSLSELLVPELSRCAARGSRPRVQYLARRSLRVGLLFGLTAAGILFSGAEALGQLLYHNEAVGRYLRLFAPLVPMLYTDSIVDAMCKGLGRQRYNARYNTLTSFLDVLFLFFLLPRLGLGGYYFSFALTHLINFCLSLRRLILETGLRPRTLRPCLALMSTILGAFLSSLLPEFTGIAGVVLPSASFLLLQGLLWSLLRVVGPGDLHWIWSLLRSTSVQKSKTGPNASS